MTDRWFDDLDGHDPDDPEAVERAERRRQRAERRAAARNREGRPASADRPSPAASDGAGRERRHDGGTRGRNGRLVALAAIGLVAVAGLWFLIALFQPFAGDGTGDGDPFRLEVPQGASVGDIGDLLSEKGVISNATLFELRATLAGRRGSLSEGSHTFRTGMSYGAVLDELEKTTIGETITVTIPEGQSRSEVAAIVKELGVPGHYMTASKQAPHLKPARYGAPKGTDSLEGFLFPATYELTPEDTAVGLVNQQLVAFKDNIAGVNMRYARSKQLSVFDVLTIASMIDREVSVAKERPLVAAVIYNRLKKGEPLGIDATIRFATGNWQKPLTESDLAIDSPYNTRRNAGLPPGPIGSPGLAAIKAAAHPADTDAWLYVVKPGTCGEHVFSSSLEEHNRNVEAYQRAQEEAGGSPTVCP